jgi:hypothetical protein
LEASAFSYLCIQTLGAAFPYEGLLPFESPSYLSGPRLVWLCGMNQTPVQRKQLAENRIDDLFESLSTGTSIYIVLNPNVAGILKQYIYEHYRKNVSVSVVYGAQTFNIYRVGP